MTLWGDAELTRWSNTRGLRKQLESGERVLGGRRTDSDGET